MAIRAEELQVEADSPGSVDIDRDRLLVLRHQRGDVEAFDELYRRYHERLVLYCERRVGDRHVAEELAQESFLRALRAMPRFAGERRFYPWMTVIAQRLCIDHHRKSARVEPAAEIESGIVESDHDALWAQVDRTHLGAAMTRLAPRHREILELREGRGWSYQQIAQHLDVPMTTVEALLHRARKALRREYLAVGGEDRNALPVLPALAGAGLVARVKAWLAAIGPERAIPALAAAATGVAAVGLVVGPLTPQPGPDILRVRAPEVEPIAVVQPDAVPPADAPAGASADPAATVAPATADAPATVPTPETGAPAIDAGVVVVFVGPEGSQAAEERGEALPQTGDVVGAVGYGADPAAIVNDTGQLVSVLLGGSTP